jgi:hypothetical protein
VKFQKLNKLVQDLFLEWLPFEHQTFSNRYIDPLDLKYLKSFQQGIETQHGKGELLEQLKTNISTLEKIAAEMFRRISCQVKGTSMDIAVNPYTISLSSKVDTTSDMALMPDENIRMDVATMWFYEEQLVNA